MKTDIDKLLGYLDSFSMQRVMVVGDVMLDKYVWGSANRISPEAPVPVVRVSRRNAVLGGAANVAGNIMSLGGHADIIGVVGDDAEGVELTNYLETAGIGTSAMLRMEGRETTVKTRVIAGTQHVVRIDSEDSSPITSHGRRLLRERIEGVVKSGRIGCIILEDYAKGLFGKDFMQAIVDIARQHGIMTMLDPHPTDSFNVKGLTLMTPNRSEAFALAGVKYVAGSGEPGDDPALLKVAGIIKRLWQPEYLLVTLGAQGMALFSDDFKKPRHIPTRARQVFDVSGAGDTVMATMTLAMLSGADVYDAARIANYAAGVVVGIVGTACITAEALRKALVEA